MNHQKRGGGQAGVLISPPKKKIPRQTRWSTGGLWSGHMYQRFSLRVNRGTRHSGEMPRGPAISATKCRGGEIRTPDLLNPIQTRYQAALRPDTSLLLHVLTDSSSRHKFEPCPAFGGVPTFPRPAARRRARDALSGFAFSFAVTSQAALLSRRSPTGEDGTPRHYPFSRKEGDGVSRSGTGVNTRWGNENACPHGQRGSISGCHALIERTLHQSPNRCVSVPGIGSNVNAGQNLTRNGSTSSSKEAVSPVNCLSRSGSCSPTTTV